MRSLAWTFVFALVAGALSQAGETLAPCRQNCDTGRVDKQASLSHRQGGLSKEDLEQNKGNYYKVMEIRYTNIGKFYRDTELENFRVGSTDSALKYQRLADHYDRLGEKYGVRPNIRGPRGSQVIRLARDDKN